MEPAATTRTKPATAATPHPFNGAFRSVRVNVDLEENDDGIILLDITAGGIFNSGSHTPTGGTAVMLETPMILNRREIQIRANGRIWHGSIISLAGDPQRKLVVGTYHIPAIPADEEKGIVAMGQDNGTWVATQP